METKKAVWLKPQEYNDIMEIIAGNPSEYAGKSWSITVHQALSEWIKKQKNKLQDGAVMWLQKCIYAHYKHIKLILILKFMQRWGRTCNIGRNQIHKIFT